MSEETPLRSTVLTEKFGLSARRVGPSALSITPGDTAPASKSAKSATATTLALNTLALNMDLSVSITLNISTLVHARPVPTLGLVTSKPYFNTTGDYTCTRRATLQANILSTGRAASFLQAPNKRRFLSLRILLL